MSKKSSKRNQKSTHGKRPVSGKTKPREIYFPSLANEELPRATIEKRKRNLKSLRWADECGYDICISEPLVGLYKVDDSVFQDYNSQEDSSPTHCPSRNGRTAERKKKKRNRSKKSKGAAESKPKDEKRSQVGIEDNQDKIVEVCLIWSGWVVQLTSKRTREKETKVSFFLAQLVDTFS